MEKRYTASEDVNGYRNLAKMFGGSALTGTSKQKDWAEKIRAEFIKNSNLENDDLISFISADILKNSRFWIENRSLLKSETTEREVAEAYRLISSTANDHYDFIVRTNSTYEKDKKRTLIKSAFSEAKWKFPSLEHFKDI